MPAKFAKSESTRLLDQFRLAERAKTYRRRRRLQADAPGPPKVKFIEGGSSNATVIEVRAVSKIGILHRIAKALTDGHIYATITLGRGRMPSYRRISPEDRWAVVHYVRDLNGQGGRQ